MQRPKLITPDGIFHLSVKRYLVVSVYLWLCGCLPVFKKPNFALYSVYKNSVKYTVSYFNPPSLFFPHILLPHALSSSIHSVPLGSF